MSAAIALAATASILCASLDRVAFSKALARLKHAIARHSSMPALEAVLIESAGDLLTLSATDATVFVRVVVPATVNAPGSLLVPLRRLVEVTRSGPRRLDIAGASINLGSVTHTMATLPTATFPTVPLPSGASLATAMRTTLSRRLAQTTYAVGEDDTRPHLAALFIERRDGWLRFVACDGHRLALARVPDDGPAFSALVAQAFVEELVRMVGVPGGVVRLHRDGDRVWFASGDEWVSGRVVEATHADAKFPDYEQVIPQGDDGAITMPARDLREVLHALAPRAEPAVKLTPELDAARVRLRIEDGDGNATEGEVLASFAGNVPAAIGFNARYLREVVGALTDDDATVKINVWGEFDPVRVDSAHGTMAVVMPMRV